MHGLVLQILHAPQTVDHKCVLGNPEPMRSRLWARSSLQAGRRQPAAWPHASSGLHRAAMPMGDAGPPKAGQKAGVAGTEAGTVSVTVAVTVAAAACHGVAEGEAG